MQKNNTNMVIFNGINFNKICIYKYLTVFSIFLNCFLILKVRYLFIFKHNIN